MLDYVRLYPKLIGAQIRSQMQYRVSFAAELVGCFLITGLDFVALAILLTRFQAIGAWTLAEVALLYGTSAISFSLTELFSGGFDGFDQLVVRGEFDRVLIRPLSVVFQMMTGAFPLRRFSRMAQGALALGLALYLLHPVWTPEKWLFLATILVSGALFFMAIFIVGATAAFWTPQTAELVNIFTYGGTFMTSYPMHIYQEWMRDVFSFIIPMAFINYYPALYLLGKPDPFGLPGWAPFLSPAIAGIVYAVAVAVWRVGVRRYQSTGS
jgi:ABC-2 type transport system permease protein